MLLRLSSTAPIPVADSPRVKFIRGGAVEESRNNTLNPLLTASPNPFARLTTIQYWIGKPAVAHVVVYDLTGKRVRTLFSGMAEAGRHSVAWDGSDSDHRRQPEGIYVVVLATPVDRRIIKLTLTEQQ